MSPDVEVTPAWKYASYARPADNVAVAWATGVRRKVVSWCIGPSSAVDIKALLTQPELVQMVADVVCFTTVQCTVHKVIDFYAA